MNWLNLFLPILKMILEKLLENRQAAGGPFASASAFTDAELKKALEDCCK